jgi:hypothetical protein
MSVYIHAPPDMFRSKFDHLQGLLSVLGMATKLKDYIIMHGEIVRIIDNLHCCTVLHVVSISSLLFQLTQFTTL